MIQPAVTTRLEIVTLPTFLGAPTAAAQVCSGGRSVSPLRAPADRCRWAGTLARRQNRLFRGLAGSGDTRGQTAKCPPCCGGKVASAPHAFDPYRYHSVWEGVEFDWHSVCLLGQSDVRMNRAKRLEKWCHARRGASKYQKD